MAYTGFTDFTPAFKDNFENGWFIQSKEQSKLWNLFADKTVQNSDTSYYKRMGHDDLNDLSAVAKGAETTFSSLAVDQRGLTLSRAGRADLLSFEEIMKMGGDDPTGQIVQRHAEAVGRERDRVIINALLGSAVVKGAASVALPAGQKVGIQYGESPAADAGLTLAKIRKAKVLLDMAGVSERNRIAIVSSEDMDNLLGVTQVTSGDYAAVKALVEGTIEGYRFMGFTWVVSNLLPSATSVRKNIFTHTNALKIGYNDTPSTTIDRLPTHNNNIAVITETWVGAVRMEEESVVEVSNVDPA